MGQPNETTDSLGCRELDTGTLDAETQQPEEFNDDVREACLRTAPLYDPMASPSLDHLPELASDTADVTPPVVSPNSGNKSPS
jgi:hypothetical protein